MDLRLKRIIGKNFATYDHLDYTFDPGLNLLLGDNGTGKSSIVEAVCWAYYGQLVRGKGNPAPSGTTQVALAAFMGEHELMVQRTRKGTKQELKVTLDDVDISGQTVTETQAKLNDMLGIRDQFISCRVFAKEFMARFAVATDKERKAMIEQLLGLGRFDVALGLCRQDLAHHKGVLGNAQARLETLREALERQRAALEGMSTKAAPEVGPLEATLKELEDAHAQADEVYQRTQAMVVKAEQSLARTNHQLAMARRDLAVAEEALAKLRRHREDSLRLSNCPVCHRAMDGDSEAAITAHFTAEEKPLAEKILARQQEVVGFEDDYSEVQETLNGLRTRVAKEREAIPPMAQIQSLRDKLSAVRASAGERIRREEEVNETVGLIEAEEAKVVEATRMVGELTAVERVLGVRGARTLLLGRALGRIEDGTNEALAHLGLGLTVTLSGTTQLKSKKEIDAIGVQVNGVLSGQYGLSSTGERSRVDAGFLLGLANLSGAAGFMAFDEVFDALDPEGASRVAAYLGELSKVRQVLVISHNADLRSEFPRGHVMRAIKEGGVSRLEAA